MVARRDSSYTPRSTLAYWERYTFEIVSITSNEPEDDRGDGKTEPDIEIISDTKFELRAERSGLWSGRKYTIIYTASDMSGNTEPDTVCVIVPHDQLSLAIGKRGQNARLASTQMLPDRGTLPQ